MLCDGGMLRGGGMLCDGGMLRGGGIFCVVVACSVVAAYAVRWRHSQVNGKYPVITNIKDLLF